MKMSHPDHCAAPSKKKTNGAERWMTLSFGEDFPSIWSAVAAGYLHSEGVGRQGSGGVYLCPTQSPSSQTLFYLEGKDPSKQPSLTVFDQKKKISTSGLSKSIFPSSPLREC